MGTQVIATTVRYDCRIAIIVVSIVFPACHVFKSYSVKPVFFFFEMGKKKKKDGKFDGDQKVKHQTVFRKKKVCNIFIIFY